MEIAARIDDSNAVSEIAALNFRYCSRMRELESEFESKASALRQEFLAAIAAVGEWP